MVQDSVDGYREKLSISWDDLKGMEKKDLKNLIKEWDTNKWLEEVQHRPSLKWYRIGKKEIGYENCYRNSRKSIYT